MPGSAGQDSNATEKTYTVRECVVFPASGNPPLSAPGLRQVPERTLIAEICPSASMDVCKQDLEKAIRQQNNNPADAARPIIWRTRPALSTEDSVDNLVTSMSDAKIRKLKDNALSEQVQSEFLVLAAELGSN